MLESIEFFESNTKLPDMLESLWKIQEFYSSKKKLLPVGNLMIKGSRV